MSNSKAGIVNKVIKNVTLPNGNQLEMQIVVVKKGSNSVDSYDDELMNLKWDEADDEPNVKKCHNHHIQVQVKQTRVPCTKHKVIERVETEPAPPPQIKNSCILVDPSPTRQHGAKPKPKVIEKVEVEPAPSPIIRNSCIFVDPSALKPKILERIEVEPAPPPIEIKKCILVDSRAALPPEPKIKIRYEMEPAPPTIEKKSCILVEPKSRS